MAKAKKTVEPYKDVKDLNWEETETVALKQQNTGTAPEIGVKDGNLFYGLPETYGHWNRNNVGAYEWTVDQVLNMMIDKVDPELKTGNPVWHWCLADDHCTFVFRDGRKVVINF